MVTEESNPEGFKTCPLCGERWDTVTDFARDRRLVVEGYMAVFNAAETGLVFVTHSRRDCGTTMTVPAGRLKPMQRTPQYANLQAGTDACERQCLDRQAFERCDAPCKMAWVREVIGYLRHHAPPEDLPLTAE